MNMEKEIINYETEEAWLEKRKVDITSTECAALFGKSKYLSPYQLWYRKRNPTTINRQTNERMDWGRRLQDSIAYGIAEDKGFNICPMKEYIRIPELRAGSSFDYRIDDETLFEIKNVGLDSFKEWWILEGEEDSIAPPDIEFQVQHQLAVSGYKQVYIGALVGGNKSVLIKRKRNEELIDQIFQAIRLFWSSVEENKPPDPDFAIDSEFISRQYSHAEPGKTIECADSIDVIVEEYMTWADTAKKADKKKKELKAKVLMEIGDAEKAFGNGYTISAGLVGPCDYTVHRDGYRNFRISTKK